MKRICKNCIKEFNINNKNQKYCSKSCRVKFNKDKYRKSLKGKLKEKEYSKLYYLKNKEKLRQKRKNYYYSHHKEEREKRKKYYYNNLNKELSEENKRKRKKFKKEYRKNPENKIKINEYQRRKLKEDKEYWIRSNLRRRLNHAINHYRRKGIIIKSKSDLINYDKIIQYLKPFPKNIKNYHIDHIKSLSSFNLINPDNSSNIKKIKKAFAPKNHQWLLVKENLIKGKN